MGDDRIERPNGRTCRTSADAACAASDHGDDANDYDDADDNGHADVKADADTDADADDDR